MPFFSIAFEGPDKLGKSTQAKLLSEVLGADLVKFPNENLYSGQVLRKILNKELPFEPASFQALQIMNRFETIPLLQPGKTYIFDRYKLSGIVYGRCDDLPVKWVRDVCNLIQDPDVTIIFYGTPYEEDTDIYSNTEYQKKIQDLYLEEGKRISGKVLRIQNNGSVREIHEKIMCGLFGLGVI
jgi:thymidylate kinase